MLLWLELESAVVSTIHGLKLMVEAIGAGIIGLGVVVALWQLARVFRSQQDYSSIRLTMAQHLALALEFQLGADILATAVSPGWEQIGKLGAIAVIRTGLNYFLTREMNTSHSP